MNTRILALTALAAAGFAAPALADEGGGAYHVYRAGPHAPAASAVQDFAGPVLNTVRLVIVLWGKGVAPITTTRIGAFASAIVNSTYLDQLGRYATGGKAADGHPGTDQTISRGFYSGKIRINPNDKSKIVSDTEIQAELAAQVASGALPPADLDTLYMVYFPPTTSVSLGEAASCTGLRAYHAAVSAQITPSNLFYAVIPDCGGGFNEITAVSSREFAEAITDPIPSPNSHPKYPQAWATVAADEIADPCEGKVSTLTAAGKTYVVQQVFDPQSNACATSAYTTP